MGERHSGDGLPGRRRGHSGGTVLGPGPAGGDAAFEARCAGTTRRTPSPPEAAQRALTAFRAARDCGAHRARTRRRDDWRPREPRRARFLPKTTLSVFLASVTLGGVAFAAIGSAGPAGHRDGDGRRARPSASAPARSAAQPHGTASGTPSARSDHPATAQDTLAHCHAYERVRGRGKALDATAWQRLVTAAGGEKNVTAYCAGQLTRAGGQKADKADEPAKSHNSGKKDKSGKVGGSGAADPTKADGWH
ncbi:hypothetical protein [Streptomyces griseochromogenes]|uniref:hypothetical protein n=1 Tax=Streptomyces griseochromogenes TaxID=68214 RepID=UPI0037A6B182